HHDPRDIALADVDTARTERDEPIDFCCLRTSARRQIKMQTVLRVLRDAGRTERDERSVSVGRADRNVAVFVVHNGPSDRFAPGVTGRRMRRLEHDRAEVAGIGKEFAAYDDAELVAFGIREYNVRYVTLSDVDVLRAEHTERLDEFLLMRDRLGDQVE